MSTNYYRTSEPWSTTVWRSCVAGKRQIDATLEIVRVPAKKARPETLSTGLLPVPLSKDAALSLSIICYSIARVLFGEITKNRWHGSKDPNSSAPV
jgi:hypothetical protein